VWQDGDGFLWSILNQWPGVDSGATGRLFGLCKYLSMSLSRLLDFIAPSMSVSYCGLLRMIAENDANADEKYQSNNSGDFSSMTI
jgi:hypothetical protein